MDLPSRLSYLFGTEEYVDLRRQLVLLREYLSNHHYHLIGISTRVMCSGSLGDGVAYPPSDDDVMFFNTSERVVGTYREASQRADLLMVPSEYSPGYCLLLDFFNSCRRSYIHVINGRSFLSSTFFNQYNLKVQSTVLQGQYESVPLISEYVSNYLRTLVSTANHFGLFDRLSLHGPCVSTINDIIDQDCAICFRCSFWPNVANDWILRNRSHGWPSGELIQSIVEHGCHVVPIGDLDSPLYLHEWRLSFSAAERTLMFSLNHVQFLTYSLLKLVLKRVIENRIPGVLCSYYVKTTIFYVTENTSRHLWQFDNIEACFKSCLSVLYDYIDNRYCPNYFIPECNMMKRKVNHTNRYVLLNLIRNLHSNGIVRTLHLCGESECMKRYISLSTIELEEDKELIISTHLISTITAFTCVLSTWEHEEIESSSNMLLRIVNLLRESKIEKLKVFFSARGIFFYCQMLSKRQWDCSRTNKRDYHFHKSLELLLRLGFRGDVTTGKLMMATYMFLIGRTESSLSHIRRLLSECPSHVLNFFSTNEITQNFYINIMCGRGHSIDYKVRSAWAPPYILSVYFLNTFPKDLKMWICIEQIFVLDPFSYAYVIESLCYFRLQNHSSLIESTRCLVDRIEELEEEFKPGSKMCVGIIKYEQGDSQSACRWLGSVYITEENLSVSDIKHQRSAFIYLACLLNKRFSSCI